VDNSAREKHGALLDSEILAEVYLELIGGRQPDFGLATGAAQTSARQDSQASGTDAGPWRPRARPIPLAPRQSAEEKAAHEAFVARMGEQALWLKRV
jgi:DNA polymerase III subunit epsilon